MNEFLKSRKWYQYLIFAILLVIFVGCLIARLNTVDVGIGKILEIGMSASISAEIAYSLSLTFNFRFEKNITNNIRKEYLNSFKTEIETNIRNKIKKECDIKFEDNEKIINQLVNKVTLKSLEIKQIKNNYYMVNQSSNQSTPDDDLYNRLHNLLEPIEDYFVHNGGFGTAFHGEPFLNLMIFSDELTMSRNDFVDTNLDALMQKLKPCIYELSQLLLLYSYPFGANLDMYKFKWVDISTGINDNEEAYSSEKIKEYKYAFERSNALLAEIVNYFQSIDKLYKAKKYGN